MANNTFQLTVANLEGIVFQGQVESVYLFGAEGEFELLAYHYPLIAALMPGEIMISGNNPIPILSGVAMFHDNDCMIVVELEQGAVQLQSGW